MYLNPTIADFKNYFVRDFVYGTDINTSVTDQDIANAYQKVNFNINQALFPSQEAYTNAYLYLSAHYLVLALQAGSQGPAGRFTWNVNSKSVGSVSEAVSIPQRILDNPEFAYLSKTNYGAEYLMMILPLLSGQIFAVHSRTNP